MSTVLTSGSSGSKDFAPHPEGQYMAVCADVFTKVKPNKYKGTVGNNGKVDSRETITSICVSFLTDEAIEIDGQLKPRYASFWATASLGTPDYPSNLRKFLKAWIPSLKDSDLATFDADKLIGRGAYLTITHSTDVAGKRWANVMGAMTPPKGASIPQIPADFVRHKDKGDAPAAVATQPKSAFPENDSAPF
jgi:hypothetical protein